MKAQRLLVLDDDALVAGTIRQIALSAGFEVQCAGDGEAFLHALAQFRPDHLVLDLVLPGMDGVQVIERLAQVGCRARLVIVSGLDCRVLEAASRTAGELGLAIAGILCKPFRPAQLRALLRDAGECPAAGGSTEPCPEQAGADQSLAEDLADAIAERDLSVAYQPKIDCGSGKLAGFEALVRWQHPVLGTIGPARFVPMAERLGLVDGLTDCVLDIALDWYARLRDTLPASALEPGLQPQLSVNLSPRTLSDTGFVERVSARCERAGLVPAEVIFELTETAAMDDPVASLGLLTRLRMKGFQLSIDDFGTGFSSMLQLVRLPFSEVKVDRSFVSSATRSHESRAVVKSIIDLGHSLGLRVAAEGVEDEATMNLLVDAGCDLAQGYLVARPLSPECVLPWIQARWPAAGARTAPRPVRIPA
ncbi:MAG: EAL domain-containing response regulator [Xanthomonadales bacterium]|nr:EAL domain-containing response regulator [Xanthomonadales bacterium]